jgi:hypothetical protein
MIKIKKDDLEWASAQGLLNNDQIDPLWSALESKPELKSKFDLLNIIYYFGALFIIFGMAWFTNKAWEDLGGLALFGLGLTYAGIFSCIGYYLFYKKNLETAGGLIATVAV